MPKINIEHVVSFSSEDPVHVADNVLSSDPAKKWKCKTPGERQSILVLQFEKASVISSIDIGNEHSAYIEVLASRSSNKDDDFKVLLVMSSFMTPLEARQSTNLNKVRMFTQDQLSKPECEQKWDRVKIVCTQPFNRHVQYGLSFITFRTPEDKTNGASVQTKIGQFVLRPDSPDDLSAGSLFAKRKEAKQEPLKGAAAIRQASSSTSLAQYGSPTCKPKLKQSDATPKNSNNSDDTKPLPRNRNELLYNKDEEEPNDKIDQLIEKKLNETKKKQEKQTPNESKTSNSKPSTSGEASKRKKVADKGGPSKKAKGDDKQRKPFSQLLQGVTIVISGIQNPDRANLRAMALEMGAKYKKDWDNSCSHLICAFQNTPKFHQVKGKGKIVKKTWIEDCHAQRKRLPWRRFALDKNDTTKPESEDEIYEEVVEKRRKLFLDSSSDEEGDSTKTQEKQENHQSNEFSHDTDEETDEEADKKVAAKDYPKKLLDFFSNKTFFIDETLDEDVCKMLERYIIAYQGIVAENPNEDVDIVITSEESVESIRSSCPDLSYLRPDWIWECHNSQAFVPTDEYEL